MDSNRLSVVQQKLSLSGKKQAKRKLSARNTMSTPNSPYWPVLSPEKEAEVENTLNTVLPPAKRSRQHIPWSELRKLTKEQRQKRRQHSSDHDKVTPNLSGMLVLGVNAVSRALGNNTLSCVLIAGDVQPRILVSHLATMSAVCNIPLVVLSSLRHFTQVLLGFSCIAVGIKKCSTSCHFSSLVELVTLLWRDVPPPKSLTDYLQAPEQDIPPEDSSGSESEQDQSLVNTSSLYLPRSDKQRAFIPEGHTPSQVNTVLPTFVPLEDQHHKPTITFQPLRIKRIQPNPNKVKKQKKIGHSLLLC